MRDVRKYRGCLPWFLSGGAADEQYLQCMIESIDHYLASSIDLIIIILLL